MAVLIFVLIHWYGSLFTQTFFHHRYSAHRMFTMSKAWEKVWFVLSGVLQGSSYLSPNTYGVLHRMHHAYADTPKDPHSPKFDGTLLKMMWKTKEIYSNLFYKRIDPEQRFTKDLPEWWSFEKIADSWPLRICWGIAYSVFYIYFATAWWQFLILPIHYVMGPFHGAIINWFAHKYGTVRFKLGDTSKNLLPVDFLMLGESYHNNHHKRANNPNFGSKWYEIDPVYPFIRLFDVLGMIKLRSTSKAQLS